MCGSMGFWLLGLLLFAGAVGFGADIGLLGLLGSSVAWCI